MRHDLKRTWSQEDVLSFAKLTGDNNPIHYDLEYASKTPFKKPIAHGLLSTSLFGTIMGLFLFSDKDYDLRSGSNCN